MHVGEHASLAQRVGWAKIYRCSRDRKGGLQHSHCHVSYGTQAQSEDATTSMLCMHMQCESEQVDGVGQRLSTMLGMFYVQACS